MGIREGRADVAPYGVALVVAVRRFTLFSHRSAPGFSAFGGHGEEEMNRMPVQRMSPSPSSRPGAKATFKLGGQTRQTPMILADGREASAILADNEDQFCRERTPVETFEAYGLGQASDEPVAAEFLHGETFWGCADHDDRIFGELPNLFWGVKPSFVHVRAV